MFSSETPSRRQFLASTAAAMSLTAQSSGQVLIETSATGGFDRRLAERELLRGLAKLQLREQVSFADASTRPSKGDLLIMLRVAREGFKNPEAYTIRRDGANLVLTGANDQAVLYAVFDFLERQGAFFGIDGESYPIDPAATLNLPAAGEAWTGTPRFSTRGLLPWPDFLNCISVFNDEDFRAYFEGMLRMRFNTFGMHVYTGAEQWTESYLSFEYGGVGHLGFLDTSATHRWGYIPQRTSRFGMGAAQFYDSDVFGADVTRASRDPWETADRTRALLRRAFSHAARLKIRTGIGFEPYQIPDEIWRALPPEVKPPKLPERHQARVDMESVTGRKLLEARLGQLLDAYPQVDYVWLWEDESMNWESRKSGIPLSTTPFKQAHDFLRRHAPKKRLVVSGWGGVARHFEHFHRNLPGEVIFSCLSDSLGWDPVHEVFGKLEGRERWPIPWLEDDPAMWLPQFHVHRFAKDLDRAVDFGCQGLLGIHWRHRIVDPTAAFQARYSWDPKPSPADYYQAFAHTQAAGDRAAKLAAVMTEADRDRKLLSTFTGEFKEDHAVTAAFSGDYSEAFTFWTKDSPAPAVVASQKEVAEALRQIAGAAKPGTEKERAGYLSRHVEMLVPYAESWILAQRLNDTLKEAADLKKAGNAEGAKTKVLQEGVPIWLKLAPEVRKTMLLYQSIIATRNDLGQLASMHNKFVRLTLHRLPLSIQEYLGEMPAQMQVLFKEVTLPDSSAPARLVVPTRPTLLREGESVRIMAIAAGPADPGPVALHLRPRGQTKWEIRTAKLMGRRTHQVALGPFPRAATLVDYYLSSGQLVSPPDAPRDCYSVTIL